MVYTDSMERLQYFKELDHYLKQYPVVALLGPRQCGKTTLARQYIKSTPSFKPINYFDLEDPTDLARLSQPKTALSPLEDLIVIDEVQRQPELFPLVRVLVDDPHKKYKFLILGSASRDLIQQSSETLAGRIRYLELTPFGLDEVKNEKQLWVRGGFPRSYLSETNEQSTDWRKSYISTFLERDIPNLGIQVPAQSLRRFWMMLANSHGQIFNASEIGQSLGIAHTTAKRYLDILQDTFMIRQLQPWHENIKKRQIKSAKIYFRDSGLFHTLLNINNFEQLYMHPKLGSSCEGFALEAILRHYKSSAEECFFWGIHNTAELDLLLFRNGKREGFEIKYSDAPTLTRSMKNAVDYLKLNKLTVIYPGNKSY